MATGVIRHGIYSYFTAATTSALYADLGGTRLYYSEAPEKITKPYCVFHLFQEKRSFTFDLNFEEVLVQFNYYGRTANEADDGVIDIKTLYDYAIITISGHTTLKMEREYVFDSEIIEPDNIWEGSVRYNLLIQKN